MLQIASELGLQSHRNSGSPHKYSSSTPRFRIGPLAEVPFARRRRHGLGFTTKDYRTLFLAPKKLRVAFRHPCLKMLLTESERSQPASPLHHASRRSSRPDLPAMNGSRST